MERRSGDPRGSGRATAKGLRRRKEAERRGGEGGRVARGLVAVRRCGGVENPRLAWSSVSHLAALLRAACRKEGKPHDGETTEKN